MEPHTEHYQVMIPVSADSEQGPSKKDASGTRYGLYIHIPFCRARCPYCQFVSETGREHIIPHYLDSITEEYHKRAAGFPQTVYIGGGTPSLIKPDELYRFLNMFPLKHATEVTIEANPESITESWLEAALSGGCNRISIGVQSLDDDELKRLGRIHSSFQAINAVAQARLAGFENISVDLMYSIPGQTIASFRTTLESIIQCAPQHISAYALAIEHDTAYAERYATTDEGLPSDEETADMYRLLVDMLSHTGYELYELSNFARNGYASLHNKSYWDFTPYIGLGVGAHSYNGEMRSWNVNTVSEYITRMEQGVSTTMGIETITEDIRLAELIMLSLRTVRGLSCKIIDAIPEPGRSSLQHMLSRYESTARLRFQNGSYMLTIDGALLADEIIAELLACLP